MLIKNYSKQAFWNYKKDADLPQEIVCERVILYGEIEDMISLVKSADRDLLLEVLDELNKANRYRKRINFFKKVIM